MPWEWLFASLEQCGTEKELRLRLLFSFFLSVSLSLTALSFWFQAESWNLWSDQTKDWMHAIIVCVSLVHGHHSTPTRGLLETPGALIWRRQYNVTSNACIPKADSLDSGSNFPSSAAKVGKDAMGQSLLEQISGQGFPTDTIKMFSNLPSSVCIVLSGPADRAFVSCYSTTDAFTTRDLREQARSSMR